MTAEAPAIATEVPAFATEEAPVATEVAPVKEPPQLSRATIVLHLTNIMVDIVGTSANDRGCCCAHHSCCGLQLQAGSKVCLVQEHMVYRDQGKVEDVLAVHMAPDGTTTCKVGFLPRNLALRVRANLYNGVYARVVSIYSGSSTNVAKRQKFWRNKGCCSAHVLGDRADTV